MRRVLDITPALKNRIHYYFLLLRSLSDIVGQQYGAIMK